MEEQGVLEVRCAGCRDTPEVERGLTEFASPGCATPQALPLELMPPPPRPHYALPLGTSMVRPLRVPCGGCGAVLAVPRGKDHKPVTRVGQVQVGTYSIHREESPIRLVHGTAEGNDFRKESRPSAGPNSISVDKVGLEHPSKVKHALFMDTEERHGENQSGAIRRTGIQKATYAVPCISEQETVEPPTQTACAEQVEVESGDNITGWNQKRKRSSKTTALNQQGERVLSSSSKEIHHSLSKDAWRQGSRNRNPIEQTASPNEDQFGHSDIDRIINRLCSSALPQKRVLQASSNDSDNIDATLPPVSTNHGIAQGDCFPHGYGQYRSVATSSLAKQGFNSVEHGMPQECLNAIVPPNKNSKQVRQNPPVDIPHRQQIQECPSRGSQSEHPSWVSPEQNCRALQE